MIRIAGNTYRYNIAYLKIAFYRYGTKAVGTAIHYAAAARMGRINENGLFRTDEPRHSLVCNLGLECDSARQPVFLHLAWDIVVHV